MDNGGIKAYAHKHNHNIKTLMKELSSNPEYITMLCS